MRRHLKQLDLPSAALWRTPRQCIVHRPPPEQAAWLYDPGSLTAALAQRYGAVTVDVLEQRWGHPSLNESRAIGVPPRRLAMVRRVALVGAGQRRVLARTIMPQAALHGRFRRLGRCGTRPLGHLLFTDPAIDRVGVQVARVPVGHPLFPELEQAAWGRRSLFSVGAGLIVVYEVFLPALFGTASSTIERKAA